MTVEIQHQEVLEVLANAEAKLLQQQVVVEVLARPIIPTIRQRPKGSQEAVFEPVFEYVW